MIHVAPEQHLSTPAYGAELQPRTEAGRRAVALAEEAAAQFAPAAAQQDVEGRFAFEHAGALRDSGFAYAPVPESLGGLGVESMHDLFIAASRVARGDASVTLGVNMHLIMFASYARQQRIALARGDERWADGLAATMKGLVRQGALIGAAVSEPDQDLTRPYTTVVREGDCLKVNGLKIVSSMAPIATHFATSALFVTDEGDERYVYVVVPANTPGVTVHDDWNALGMRSSGSVTVTFKDALVAQKNPGGGSPAGRISAAWLDTSLTSGAAHASASLGVAESAYSAGIDAVQAKLRKQNQRQPRMTVQMLAAENSVEIAAARAIFGRSLELVDAYFEAHLLERGTLDEARLVFAEVQRAKSFVNAAAPRIVDRSMTMVGGSAYASAHPLARHYRDARAGAFMHPLAANVAHEFIGAEALGIPQENF